MGRHRWPFRRRRAVVMRMRYRSFWQFWWAGWYIVPTLVTVVWALMAAGFWPGGTDPWWLRVLWVAGALWTADQATRACRRRWRQARKIMSAADERVAEARRAIERLDRALALEEMTPEVRAEGLQVRRGWVAVLALAQAEKVRLDPWSGPDPASWVTPA